MGQRYKSYGFLGKKHSSKTKLKIAESSRGRTHTMSEEGKKRLRTRMLGRPAWNKGLKYPAISKSKHWNWKGGITKKHLAIRASAAYKQWRTAVLERDGYKCVLGGKRHGNKLVADHIKSFSKHPKLRLALSNGRTLCTECHKKTDNYCGKALTC